ncbi:hypothetical protein ACIQU6_03345 [Streptomyces sp. NPDC090442]|uniref:hypothetical protein n=1 Tax=Streptomyces sp. NPDC090442 TaxID=3365962 RepID=UPI00380140F9
MTGHGTHRAASTRTQQDPVDAACEELRTALADMQLSLPELTVTPTRDGVVLGTADPRTTRRMAKALTTSNRRWRWWFSLDGWVVGAGFACIVGSAILITVSYLVPV